jgi:hypothetical protein
LEDDEDESRLDLLPAAEEMVSPLARRSDVLVPLTAETDKRPRTTMESFIALLKEAEIHW